MEKQETDIRDYLNALRRRRRGLMAIMGVLLAVAVAVAFGLPPKYRSTARILIESQEIPAEYVQSMVTSYASKRIERIRKRVMVRSNLVELIKRHSLYAEERDSKTPEQLTGRLKKNVKVETISAQVRDPRTGRPGKATIAFTISFDGPNPQVAQKVAGDLTTLFLNESAESRARQAQGTYTFLSDEAERLEKRIEKLAGKLAEFKEENVNRLPEFQGLNMERMEHIETRILDIETQLRSLKERRFNLKSQLTQTSPTMIYSENGQRILGPEARLKALRSEYLTKAAQYTAKHPDVRRLERKIDALAEETGETTTSTELVKKLEAKRSELSEARAQYADDHPDVDRLEETVAELEGKVRSEAERLKEESKAKKESVNQVAVEDPDNPAYISLKSQLNSVTSQIDSLEKEKRQLRKQHQQYAKRLATTPQVERRYANLERQLKVAEQQYQDLTAKQMKASVSKQLETEAKGEHFTLIEPPTTPEEPVSPNRFALLFLGLVLSAGAGVGYVAVAESFDRSVRGVKGVTRILGVPPLAVIPHIEGCADRTRRRRRRMLTALILILLAALAAAYYIIA